MLLSPLPQSASLAPERGFRPHWTWATLVLFSSNILSLALPLLTLQIYDRILVYAYPGTLNLLCLGVIVALLFEGGLRVCRAYVIGWSSAVFDHVTTSNLIRHALAVGKEALQYKNPGEYIQQISGIGKVRDLYAGRLLATMIDVPFVLIFLGFIAYLGRELVFVPLAFLAFMALSAWGVGRNLTRQLKGRNDADNRRYAYLMQCLGNIHVAKATGYEALFERLYEKKQYGSSSSNYGVVCANAAMFDLGLFVARAIMIAVVFYGFPLVLNGRISMGALIACVILTGRIIHPMQRMLNYWAQHKDAQLANEDLVTFFSMPENYVGKGMAAAPRGTLEIKNLSGCDPLGNVVFDKINMRLTMGQSVSLSGDNPDDVQTFVRTLVGLVTPSQGEVFIDGVNPRHFSSATLTQHMGYLSSEGGLFRGTVYDNLSRFQSLKEERVREMAELLSIDVDIARMPAGYDTYLEGGKVGALSTGFEQRLAIARVLASKPKIVIFNNADRALDKDSFNSVYKLLARLKGRATLVLVSNDINIQRLADEHWILRDRGLVALNEYKGDNLYSFRSRKEEAP